MSNFVMGVLFRFVLPTVGLPVNGKPNYGKSLSFQYTQMMCTLSALN